MKGAIFMMVLLALAIPAAAWTEDGWSSYTDEPSTGDYGPPPGFVNPPFRPLETDATADDPAPATGVAKGEKGDPGPAGPQGPQGEKGDKGDSADLCQNIDGVQTSPGFKYWAQRYWKFNPKREKRYIATNMKGQIVCVTLRWIRHHTPFRLAE